MYKLISVKFVQQSVDYVRSQAECCGLIDYYYGNGGVNLGDVMRQLLKSVNCPQRVFFFHR